MTEQRPESLRRVRTGPPQSSRIAGHRTICRGPQMSQFFGELDS